MKSSPDASPDAVEALSKLTQVIERPALRKSFHADPVRTLQEAGVDTGALPPDLLDHLAGLSLDELGLVSRLNTALVGSGMSTIGRDGGTVAIL